MFVEGMPTILFAFSFCVLLRFRIRPDFGVTPLNIEWVRVVRSRTGSCAKRVHHGSLVQWYKWLLHKFSLLDNYDIIVIAVVSCWHPLPPDN